MMRTEQPAGTIAKTIAILEKAKLWGKVKIAFDEWNLRSWHHPTLSFINVATVVNLNYFHPKYIIFDCVYYPVHAYANTVSIIG